MKKFFDGIYEKAYGTYKLFPAIIAAIIVFGGFVFGIIDAFEEITDIGDLEILAVFVWLIIGAVAAAILFAFAVILISPTVVRTDAVLEIAAATKNGNNNSATVVDTNELPEL